VVIGIAGELVQGLTMTISFQRKTPELPLDTNEMEVIVRRCQEKAYERAKRQLSIEVGGRDVEIKLVNSAIIQIMIDGYAVTNPIGFQGKDVKIQLYCAFAPLVHIGALERIAEKLDLDLLAVAAEPFAVGRAVIGDDPNANMSAILMDVGGGTTDIAVLNEGGLEGTKMFGIGGRAYTKSITRDLGVDFIEAESLKVGLQNSTISQAKRDTITNSLTKTLRIWMDGIELALSEFDHLDHLPQRILLCGGGASLPLLSKQLATTEWHLELPFTKKPIVQLLSPDQVIGFTDATGKVIDHTFITAMGLLRVGCDTIGQAELPAKSSIKRKLNKLLST
jgi:cell division protein FtsA